MKYSKHAAAALALSALSGLSPAVPINVSSYDMPNGSGQASGGNFNYWDLSYTGSGSTTTDGAALSGGTGDLTDGITTPLNWNNVENNAGTGPYVGWRITRTVNPVVRFNFASTMQINSVTVHLDDANGFGGVNPPTSIDLSTDGVTFTTNVITNPASSSPFSITLPFSVSSGSVYVRFNQNTNGGWVFVDEVSFDGAPPNAIPEPLVPVLLGTGLLALGFARKRKSAG